MYVGHQYLGFLWSVLPWDWHMVYNGMERKGWSLEGRVGRVTFEVSESQVVEWVQQMSPEAKHDVLRALIPRLDALETLLDYGRVRVRALSSERGLDWDSMAEQDRELLIDELLHEDGA
jgi:hypothetical protein